MSRRVIAVLLLLLSSVLPCLGAVTRYAYVANIQDNTISMFTVNASTGQFRSNGYALAGISPRSIAVVANKFVYVANDTGTSSGSGLWGYTINSNGTLNKITTATTGLDASAVAADPTGRFLYVANAGSNNVSAFVVGSAGMLTAIAGSPFSAGTQPRYLAVDPSGKFLYVVNQSSNNISAFVINTTSGALSHVSGSPFPTGYQPFAVAVDPLDRFVFVANSGSNDVSVFKLASTGALTPVTGSPFAASTGPKALVADNTGRYLYVSDYGSNKISAYAIGSTGMLTQISGSPYSTGNSPRAVSVDASNQFLYVAEAGSRDVFTFRISATGTLTAVYRDRVRTRGAGYSVGIANGSALVQYVAQFAYAAVYAEINGPGLISAFSIAADGSLAAIAGYPQSLSVTPMEVTADPYRRFTYFNASDRILAYAINGTTGALTSIGTFAVAANAWHIGVEPSGRFLYVATPAAATLAGYKISSSGSLTKISSNTASARNFAIDPAGKFLFVLAGSVSAPVVKTYSISASSGTLAAVASVTPSSSAERVVIDSTGKFVYVVSGTQLEVYSVATSGALTKTSSLAANAPWSPSPEPWGRFLYSGGPTGLLGFAIGSNTGKLSLISSSPFLQINPEVNVVSADFSGRFVYATDSNGGDTLWGGLIGTDGSLTAIPGAAVSIAGQFCCQTEARGVVTVGTIH